MNTWLQKESVTAYIRLFRRLLLTALIVYLVFYIAPMILGHILPFLFAFLFAFFLNPLITWLNRKIKAPRGLLSVIMVLTVVLLIVGAVGGLLFALINELITFAQNLDSMIGYVTQFTRFVSANINAMSANLPFDTRDVENVLNNAMESLLTWIQAQGATIAETAISISIYGATGVGNFIVSFIFFLMTSYFAMARFPQIKEKLREMAGETIYGGLRTLKKIGFSAVGGYLRVLLIMASIVSVFSLVAFLIVGQSYAVLLALLIFVLDFLPLVGAGGLLVPWGIISIIMGDVWYGVFLIGMYAVIFMMHRIIEPKIMGREMGLSPIIALLSLYLGMRVGGVAGLILAPMIATVVVSFYKAGLFDGLIRDLRAVINLYGKKDNKPESESG